MRYKFHASHTMKVIRNYFITNLIHLHHFQYTNTHINIRTYTRTNTTYLLNNIKYLQIEVCCLSETTFLVKLVFTKQKIVPWSICKFTTWALHYIDWVNLRHLDNNSLRENQVGLTLSFFECINKCLSSHFYMERESTLCLTLKHYIT